MAEIVC